MPVRWIVLSGPIGALLSALLIAAFAVVDQSSSACGMVLAGFGVSVVVLAQDLLRFRLFMLDKVSAALLSDLIWLISTLGCLGVFWAFGVGQIEWVAVAWGGGALLALIAALSFARGGDVSRSSFPATWRLGRWSLLETALSSGIVLLPLFVSGLVAESAQVGTYRVLQSATGPLNLVNSAITVSFGLGAWALVNRAGLDELTKKVRRMYLLLLPLGLAVACLVQPLVLYVAGIPISRDTIWPMVAVGISAMMGIVISPLQAAAQALGYQRFGAAIRAVVVVVGIGVSGFALLGVTPFDEDPIGASLLLSGAFSMIGWVVGYRLAMRIERK